MPETPQLRQFFQKIETSNNWTLTLSNHSYGYTTSCSRAGQYYILERRKFNKGVAALNMGTIFHTAMEIRARVSNPEQQQQLQQSAIERFFQLNPVEEFEWRTSDRALELVEKYAKKYKTDLVHVLKDTDGNPVTEIKFTLPLGTIDIGDSVNIGRDELVYIDTLYVQWTGRIDELVELDGQHWVLDFKTSSKFGPAYFNQFALSQQTIGYTWAARKLLPTYDVAGAIIDLSVLRKPTPTGRPFDFDRQRFIYSHEQTEEWQHNTLEGIATFVSHLKSSTFPMTGTTSGCVFKYGKCPYFDVCTLPQRQRHEMLYSSQYSDANEHVEDVSE
jgi:PD-(D/E)XK nuclease superfamily